MTISFFGSVMAQISDRFITDLKRIVDLDIQMCKFDDGNDLE